MQIGEAQFFELIGEGAGLLKGLDEDAPDFFASLSRVREILALIADGPAPADPPAEPAPFALDLSTPEAAQASMVAYLNGPMMALPPGMRTVEAIAIRNYWPTGADYPEGVPQKLRDAFSPEYAEQVEREISARGLPLPDGFDREKAAVEVELAKVALNDYHPPEWVEVKKRYDAIADELNAAIAAKADTDATDPEELNRLQQRVDEATREFNDSLEKREAERLQVFADRRKRITEQFAAVGLQINAGLKARSKVTDEQAKQWGDSIELDSSIKAKLKKLGYPVEQFRADAAEFYQITGGKLPAIEFVLDGRRRANAKGINDTGFAKQVALGAHFNKSVLFHELGHHLEFDPIAKAAANGFLKRRRDSADLFSLRSLTGNKGYSSDERAWRDKWVHPYIGKFYSDGVTEVFSMGLEMLANPMDATMIAAKDPEMLALITGYVGHDLTALHQARISKHEVELGAREQAIDKAAKELEDAEETVIAYARESFVKDFDWLAQVKQLDKRDAGSVQYAMGIRSWHDPNDWTLPEGAKFIGAVSNRLLFSGKFKRSSGRIGRAVLVVKADGWTMTFDSERQAMINLGLWLFAGFEMSDRRGNVIATASAIREKKQREQQA
jgi:hypothetical protein